VISSWLAATSLSKQLKLRLTRSPLNSARVVWLEPESTTRSLTFLISVLRLAHRLNGQALRDDFSFAGALPEPTR
jgi:hypothetical protein